MVAREGAAQAMAASEVSGADTKRRWWGLGTEGLQFWSGIHGGGFGRETMPRHLSRDGGSTYS
jgi:hypothetical protein